MVIKKSTVDENVYKRIVLSNGISVILVHNPKFSNSSCALSVEVGSSRDPEELPGLAHFLEHMLFMGTEPYPEENMFHNFLSQHNGHRNAFTSRERTVYYCDADSSQLKHMAHMFSHFFISPLLREDSVKREINAVNSEYLNSLNAKAWRDSALLKEFMKESIPEKQFSCGNAETLGQENIRERVVDFWKKNYSSDLMSLAICGRDSIQELGEIAEMFALIPNIHLNTGSSDANQPDIYSAKPADLFKEEFYSKVVQVAPLQDTKELHISIVLPPTRSCFKANPLSYIKFVFTSEKPGSLFSTLKNERLGFGISFSFIYFERYTRVKIKVDLTEDGAKEHAKVLSLIRSYLSSIRADENEYLRLRRITEETFLYMESGKPADLAITLCQRLYFYPEENILDLDYLHEDYDPKLIDHLILQISDSSKWIIFLSDINGTFESKEKYYNVEYNVIGEFQPDDSSSASLASTAGPHAEDVFLDRIELIETNAGFDDADRFVKTESFESGKVCLFFDKKFKVPKSEISIFLKNKIIEEDMASLKIFLRLASDAFSEKFSRMLENCHVSMGSEVTTHWVLLKFTGFSSKIVDVAKLFVSTLDDVSLDRFDVIKQELIDKYSNLLTISPFRRTLEVFHSKQFSSRTSEELLEAAKCVGKDQIGFFDSYYTEILAVGNIRFESVLDLFNAVKSTGLRPDARINEQLGPISFETFDKNNNMVALFYKINDFREKFDDCADEYNYNSAVGRLIYQICHEAFFRKLRTEEQLGYVVQALVKSFLSIEYLIFIVQSEKEVEFLETRISQFVAELKESIGSMKEEDFSTFKEGLVGFYDESILSLGGFGSHIFDQFKRSIVDLKYNEKMIEIVKTLRKDELLESTIWDKYIKLFSTRK